MAGHFAPVSFIHRLTDKSSDQAKKEDVTVQTAPASPSKNCPTPAKSVGKTKSKNKATTTEKDEAPEHKLDREDDGRAKVAAENRNCD